MKKILSALAGATLLAALFAPAAAQAAVKKYNPDLWVSYSAGSLNPGGGTSCSNADYSNIQTAVSNSNNGDVIHICPGWWELTNDINSDHWTITLEGEGPAKTRIDMNGQDRFFNGYEDDGGGDYHFNDVVIRGLYIYDGYSNFGGAVLGYRVTCENSVFVSNFADDVAGSWSEEGMGGAVFAYFRYDGNGCKYYDNDADNQGGAVKIWNGSLYSKNELYSSNGGYVDYGGAIHQNGDGSLKIENSTFVDNDADYDGGAVYTNAYTSATFTGNLFKGNYVGDDGGAIYSQADDQLKVMNNRFLSNYSDGDGGALYVEDDADDVYIVGNNFTRNEAYGEGGGFLTDAVDTWMRANSYSGNYSYAYGGSNAWVDYNCGTVFDYWSSPSWGPYTGNTGGSNRYNGGNQYWDIYGC